MPRPSTTHYASVELAELQDSNELPSEEQNNRDGNLKPVTCKRPERSQWRTAYRQGFALLSVIAVLVILTKCAGFSYLERGKQSVGRQLAGREDTSDEDPDVDAMVELCLGLASDYGEPAGPPLTQPQTQWMEQQLWQEVSASQQDAQTSTQGDSFPTWSGPVPYSSTPYPQALQDPGMQTGHTQMTSLSTWEGSWLSSSWSDPQPHRGFGAPWGDGWSSGSGNAGEAFESPGEGPSTSAPRILFGLHSTGAPHTTVAEGSSGSAPLVADSATPSHQVPQPPSSADSVSSSSASGDVSASSVLSHSQGTSSSPYSELRHLVSRNPPKPPVSPEPPPAKTRRRTRSTGGLGVPKKKSMPSSQQSPANQETRKIVSSFWLSTSTSQEAPSAECIRATHQVSGGPPGCYLGEDKPSGSPIDSSAPESSNATGRPGHPIGEHPFYRTPVLQPGFVARPFSLAAARAKDPRVNMIDFTFRFMRSLFVQDSISQVDIEGLLRKMEDLAGHLIHFQTKVLLGLAPRDAVKALGIRYLILDTLYAASTALGDPRPWWEELVANVPHEVEDYDPFRRKADQYQVNIRLVKALSDAVALLKTGTRPGKRQTIELKRELFCGALSPRYFKTRNWDPWRNDYSLYGDGDE
ncbi:hypothetical protein, conserved [Eimeria acervulina]|uniref:Transmembrane protein n=1 Tax=Eimeria acervulina TaxID=5801 RepID=U6GBS8_EIMAC|nr:hypothetical protein, conserved [Eimeria acervulina]CDI76798.1 hypothetical protein, conserved [Eimeria acervulina]